MPFTPPPPSNAPTPLLSLYVDCINPLAWLSQNIYGNGFIMLYCFQPTLKTSIKIAFFGAKLLMKLMNKTVVWQACHVYNTISKILYLYLNLALKGSLQNIEWIQFSTTSMRQLYFFWLAWSRGVDRHSWLGPEAQTDTVGLVQRSRQTQFLQYKNQMVLKKERVLKYRLILKFYQVNFFLLHLLKFFPVVEIFGEGNAVMKQIFGNSYDCSIAK